MTKQITTTFTGAGHYRIDREDGKTFIVHKRRGWFYIGGMQQAESLEEAETAITTGFFRGVPAGNLRFVEETA